MSIIPVDALSRHVLSAVFMTGNVPTMALRADPRVSYAAYIPEKHYAPIDDSKKQRNKMPLVISVHGTSRTHMRHITAWRGFADKQRCAIVAPLFLAMIQGPLDIDGYHYLGVGGTALGKMQEKALEVQVRIPPIHSPGASMTEKSIRHDLCLLAMLDEVALRWPGIDTSRVFLSGFSGGAQFVHRFLYLHPERVLAAAVDLPGSVTFLDESKIWPAGTKDW